MAAVDGFEQKIEGYDVPSDGLVLVYDDIAYGQSLGTTAKFPRDSIAFKWADEVRETTLTEIEWSPSRTGLINPIAVFEPVELEGTTVSRASVHNISICGLPCFFNAIYQILVRFFPKPFHFHNFFPIRLQMENIRKLMDIPF